MLQTLPSQTDKTDTWPPDSSAGPDPLEADGWPAMRGTAGERDARFVRALTEAQRLAQRGGR